MSRYTPTPQEIAVRDALALCLPSATILYANQDGPRPTGVTTYLTVYLISETPQGLPSIATGDVPDAGGLYAQETDALVLLGVSVQAFGPEAYTLLTLLRKRMTHPSLIWQVGALGVRFRPTAAVTRTSAILDAITENRAAITFDVEWRARDAVQVAAVEQVRATGVLAGSPPDLVTLLTQDMTTP